MNGAQNRNGVGQENPTLGNLMERLYNQNMYETFLCIAILTFTGGFLNAYTFILHGGYLSTMNTGNMARIGLAISMGDMTGTSPYFMSIAANALGAMAAFMCREIVSRRGKMHWQKLCLLVESVVFFCVAMLPATVPHAPVNFVISFMAGLQLATFTICEGSTVSTTIASGNIRFVGEYMGNAILNPRRKNFIKLLSFFLIIVTFVFGVVVGSGLSRSMGGYSLCLISALMFVPLFCESFVTWRVEVNIEDFLPEIYAALASAVETQKDFVWLH